MIIPENKDYLIFVKTAKTGGASCVEILKEIAINSNIKFCTYDNIKNIVTGDILLIVNDQMHFFKENYPHIFDKSYFVMISRHPYTRLLSGWKYHYMTKNRNLYDLLDKPIMPPKKPYEIEWEQKMPKYTWDLFSMYNHFYCSQTEAIIFDDVFIMDYIIVFENFDEEINKFLEHIQYNKSIEIPHCNKFNNLDSNYLYDKKHIIAKINEMFDDDFRLLGYSKIE